MIFNSILRFRVFEGAAIPGTHRRTLLGLFGTLKLVLALQFIVMNAYFSVARTLTLVLHVTLK